jgi:protoporphyrinogen oxidase
MENRQRSVFNGNKRVSLWRGIAMAVDTDHGICKVVVLGAGITGLTVAWELSKAYPGRVTVLEKEPTTGGFAATLRQGDLSLDLGSHRLHEGYHPEVDALIKQLCGDSLLRRERRGLIFLGDRALDYPPSALDIMLAFGLGRFLRFSSDLALARLNRIVSTRDFEDFERYTTSMVGRSLYEQFYRPYALKLYGMSPREISKDPAISRVRKFAFSSLLSGLRRRVKQTYLYPAGGIGHIAHVLQQNFLYNGGQVRFISGMDELRVGRDAKIRHVTCTSRDGSREVHEADLIVSTIPLDAMHHLVQFESDRDGLPAFDLRWRALRLLFLVTKDEVLGEHETYYFPEPDILFGRVSELNKYSPLLNWRRDEAVLTVEIPCSQEDEIWNMPDDSLAELCIAEFRRLGILRPSAQGVVEFSSKCLKNVYPVYDLGWRDRFERIYRRLDAVNNLYLIGRTALFLHCNIDHCILMALKLAAHLANGRHTKDGWDAIRREFFNYRVRE